MLWYTCWRHEAIFDVIYFLTSWGTFDRKTYLLYLFTLLSTFLFYDICFYAMTYFPYFLTSWRACWRNDMTYFPYLLTSWHTFWRFSILFDVMLWHNFWLSRRSFRCHVMSWCTFWRYDILSMFVDVMVCMLMAWCTFRSNNVLYDIWFGIFLLLKTSF